MSSGRKMVERVIRHRSDLTPDQQALDRFSKAQFCLADTWPYITDICCCSGVVTTGVVRYVSRITDIGESVIRGSLRVGRRSAQIRGEKLLLLSTALGMEGYHTYFTGSRHFDADFSSVWSSETPERPHPLMVSGDARLGRALVQLIANAGFNPGFAKAMKHNPYLASMDAAWRVNVQAGVLPVSWLQLDQLLDWIKETHPDQCTTYEYRALVAIRNRCPKVLQVHWLHQRDQLLPQPKGIPMGTKTKARPVDETSKPAVAAAAYEPAMATRFAANALTIIQSPWGQANGLQQPAVLELAGVSPQNFLGQLKANKFAHVLYQRDAANIADVMQVSLDDLLAENVPDAYFRFPEKTTEIDMEIDYNSADVKRAVGWNIKSILHVLDKNFGWLRSELGEVGYEISNHIPLVTLRTGGGVLNKELFSALLKVFEVSSAALMTWVENEARADFWRTELGAERVVNADPEAFKSDKSDASSEASAPAETSSTAKAGRPKQVSGEEALVKMMGGTKAPTAHPDTDESPAESDIPAPNVSDETEIVWDGKKSVTIDGVTLDLQSKGKGSPRYQFAEKVMRLALSLPGGVKGMMEKHLPDITSTYFYSVKRGTMTVTQERAEAAAQALGVTVRDLFVDALPKVQASDKAQSVAESMQLKEVKVEVASAAESVESPEKQSEKSSDDAAASTGLTEQEMLTQLLDHLAEDKLDGAVVKDLAFAQAGRGEVSIADLYYEVFGLDTASLLQELLRMQAEDPRWQRWSTMSVAELLAELE